MDKRSSVVVDASSGGNVTVSDSGKLFVEAAAARIMERLTGENRSFRLMPYRHFGGEYLGFDWHDEVGESISFTFTIGALHPHVPAVISPNHTDVIVSDATDALLLAQLVVQRVINC